jgi:RNA polymerase sigma factor (sigma-70 family)
MGDDAVRTSVSRVRIRRHLPEFHYDPKVCRFKTWLLNQTSWRIKDQLKKRRRGELHGAPAGRMPAAPAGQRPTLQDDTARTATVERVPDAAAVNLDALFEAEWRKNLLAAALERVQAKFSLKQFQIFDLNAIKEWPAGEVAKSLGVSLASVYVTKHRVAAALKKEMAQLERSS